MGNNCSPGKPIELPSKVSVREKMSIGSQSNEKYSEVLNTYKSKNEKMQKELEYYRNKDKDEKKAKAEQNQENKKFKEKLAAMQSILEEKERALLKHRLEAALHSKATFMVAKESVARQIISGHLEKFGKAGKSKSTKLKWVEVNLYNSDYTENGFQKGHMILSYADSKNSHFSSRCKILSVSRDSGNVGVNFKGRTFSITALMGDDEKELVFACQDELTRNAWLKACSKGLEHIERDARDMNEPFFLKLQFKKEKLGIGVEEFIRESSISEKKSSENFHKEGIDEIGGRENSETSNEAKCEVINTDEDGEPPCELVVKTIVDEDLIKAGLTLYSTLASINDTPLRGLTYQKQIDLLQETKKPFTLTFTGPKYLQKRTLKENPHFEILQELVAEDENQVRAAFCSIVQGTFRNVLDSSDNPVGDISELLASERRLTAMLRKIKVM